MATAAIAADSLGGLGAALVGHVGTRDRYGAGSTEGPVKGGLLVIVQQEARCSRVMPRPLRPMLIT